jgi:probable HAF family extracellular repeat protein
MFTVLDLGSFGSGLFGPGAQGINNAGQVVGFDILPGNLNPTHAFRTAPNMPINPLTDDLGTLGGNFSQANGINNAGQVVGNAARPDGFTHAFRTAPNRAINPLTDDLGTLAGGGSQANGINDAGQVVGSSQFPEGTGLSHAFRTAPNMAINPLTDDLGALSGRGDDIEAAAINSVGQVVGISANLRPQVVGAFRTAPNMPINPLTDDLGTLGGTDTSAAGINDAGQVVGSSSLTGFSVSHAYRTAPNMAINPLTDDLGTLGGINSFAESINSAGQVVGASDVTGDVLQHAFYFDGTKLFDLNNLIPPGLGFTLFDAPGINDLGQIVADYQDNANPLLGGAVLLTPQQAAVPEPATLTLFVIGLLGGVGYSSWRRRQA